MTPFTKKEWERIKVICRNRKAHYERFLIPKRSGGKREILAPSEELKGFQEKVLLEFLYAHFVPSVYATGFVKDRSIVHNAMAHVGAGILVNVDLKDFFPTITYDMVYEKVFLEKLTSMEHTQIKDKLFKKYQTRPQNVPMDLPKDEDIKKKMNMKRVKDEAKYLSKLVTYPYKNKEALPQGAPTSPAISNIICFEMDNVLAGMAARNKAVYTRYADDLTFSSNDNRKLNRTIPVIKEIVKKYGFKANEKKIHVNRKGGRMQVTGLVVNDKVSYGRGRFRIIRAQLHNAKMSICKDKVLVPFDVMHFRGMAAYINSFDKEKAQWINEQVDEIVEGLKQIRGKESND